MAPRPYPGRLNLVHNIGSYFAKIKFNIILSYTPLYSKVVFVFIICSTHITKLILFIRHHEGFSRKIIRNYGQIQEICHFPFQGKCALDILLFCIRTLYVDMARISRTCLKSR
jgi:hypothetical protein